MLDIDDTEVYLGDWLMPKHPIEGRDDECVQSVDSIWVNAESFGYGPSAIAFSLLPQLRKLTVADTNRSPTVEFVGAGLALELNASPPWDAVHVCDINASGGAEKLIQLFQLHRPKLVVTVGDQSFADAVTALGAQVVVIDTLLWFWRSIPTAWLKADLLLVPNFVGVSERIRSNNLTNAVILPTLRPEPTQRSRRRKGTLINLGGLQTPFMPVDMNIEYARMVLHAVYQSVELCGCPDDEPITAFASERIRLALMDEFPGCFQVVTPDRARCTLSECRTAFLTPGMGNILDSVDFAEKAGFLPACSETQGLQPALLRQIGAYLNTIDWHDMIPDKPAIDYWAPLKQAFWEIRHAHEQAIASDLAQKRLANWCMDLLRCKEGNVESLRKRLPDALGRGEGYEYAQAIANCECGLMLR